MTTEVTSRSPLLKMTETTPTCLWNDSAAVKELSYSIENGGVGATCNPVIVTEVLKSEMDYWEPRIRQLVREMPKATEDEISWKLVEEISKRAAALLKPVFDKQKQKGKNGRLSVQTDPRFYRNPDPIVEQAVHFNGLAPNVIVKIPVTKAGVAAIEETTYHGVSINATVCFTLPQCVAVAEAVERGLKRREKEGKDIATMGPVCTIMVGRLDDWIKLIATTHKSSVDPKYFDWAGIAVFKKTYKLFRERGYRLRLLSAAFRNENHCHELIGGDIVISPPYKWQVQLNASKTEVMPRIDKPVDPEIVNALTKNFKDFERSYTEGGISLEDFDTFGPTVRTLRQFIAACSDLNAQVREIMLPNPDSRV